MWRAIAVVFLVAGCAADAAPPDADEGTINAPVGAACSTKPTPWCGGGGSWCLDGVCRQLCAPPDLRPVCSGGAPTITAGVCYCVPD
jgi:hypothetical protein